MIGRAEIYIKWALYGLATAALLALQGVLQEVRILGVLPYLYPVLAAVLAMYEGPFPGAVYGLVLGLVCDATIPGPIPCLHVLVFPLVGLGAGLIARHWLPAGFPCSLVVSAAAFLLTDAFRCLLLRFTGGMGGAAVSVALRETVVSLLFTPVVLLAFRAVFRKCRLED